MTTIKLHIPKDLPEEVNVETTEQDIQDLEADTDHRPRAEGDRVGISRLSWILRMERGSFLTFLAATSSP